MVKHHFIETPLDKELIIIRQRYTPFGGAERFIASAVDQLAASGMRVRILCREWQGDGQYQVTRLRPLSLTRRMRDKGFARLACLAVTASPNALVQSHERIPCCDIYRAGDGVHHEWLRQRGRKRGKWQSVLDQVSPYHRYVLQAEQRLFQSRRLKRVICNSSMVRDEIQTLFRLPDEKLVVIHNGVDTTRYHPDLKTKYRTTIRESLGIDASTMLFLFAGSGYERKGLDAVLQALAKNKVNAQLLILGKDKREARYRQLSKRLGIGHRVHFLGPQNDLGPYYGASDALLLPALYDPFPNVVMEAMACGLAVVISTKCGVTDIVRPDHNGFICDALDLTSLGESMLKLTSNALCTRLGENARETVKTMTMESMKQSYLKLYEDMLDTK